MIYAKWIDCPSKAGKIAIERQRSHPNRIDAYQSFDFYLVGLVCPLKVNRFITK